MKEFFKALCIGYFVLASIGGIVSLILFLSVYFPYVLAFLFFSFLALLIGYNIIEARKPTKYDPYAGIGR